MKKFGIFLLCLGLCFLPGSFGSFFTLENISPWYETLVKPSWNPPNWVFGPVWMTLYFLMAVALFLVLTSSSSKKTKAVVLFFVQLILNGLWSFLFFGLKNPSFAFIEILFLWFFILLSLDLFWKIRPLAGALLVPYLVWVSFAAYLNYTIWQLNPA